MHLNQNDLEFFEQLVSNYSSDFLKRFREQEKFLFLGREVRIADKDRYCTMSGFMSQVADFPVSAGIIYHVDESNRSISKRCVILKS